MRPPFGVGELLQHGRNRVLLLGRKESAPAVKVLLVDAMRQSTLKQLPAPWLTALGRELRTGKEEVRLAVIALARERSVKPIDAVLTSMLEGLEC